MKNMAFSREIKLFTTGTVSQDTEGIVTSPFED